jgi:hypothetical protein
MLAGSVVAGFAAERLLFGRGHRQPARVVARRADHRPRGGERRGSRPRGDLFGPLLASVLRTAATSLAAKLVRQRLEGHHRADEE